MAIEIIDLPMKNLVIFHSYVYQRVYPTSHRQCPVQRGLATRSSSCGVLRACGAGDTGATKGGVGLGINRVPLMKTMGNLGKTIGKQWENHRTS